jgi:dipeptidyl aminopeptidase/acylaminoacyl peptidase
MKHASLAGLLCLALMVPVSGSADTLMSGKAPDIETFMQIGFSGNPRISIDGGYLFFISNSPGVSQIFRMDLKNRWPYQLTVFPEGVDFYSLSEDGKYIVCGVAWGGNENSQLWLLDAATGQAEALTEAPEVRFGNASWSPDSKTIYYRSNEANGKDFFIYAMDLSSRKTKLIADLPGWNNPGDVSSDGRYLLVTHWDSNTNSEIHMIDLQNGNRTHLTEHEGQAVFYAGQFDRDTQSLFLISNQNPDGLRKLATLHLRSKDLTFLDPSSTWEVGSVGLSPDRSLLAWTINEGGYDRMHIKDLDTERKLPTPPVDGQFNGFAFTSSGTMVLAFASATNTSDIWLWDWNAPEFSKLTHSTYAGIDPSIFSAPELVEFTSFDGREIPAFLYLPPGREPGTPVPFVVHMHGGPESQFRPVFIRHFQYLLLNGYGILAPNVRGSSGYGKEYMDLDNYKNRLDSVKDLKAAADFLIAQGYSAPGMMAVKGGSYGGYMTLAAITEYPDLFSAAVDQVGIASFVTFLENTADYRRHLREAEYGPLTDREFLESVSPLNKAGSIRTPLLVIHGENDPRVPVGEARQIAKAIEANGGSVELLIFPDEGHGVSKRPNVLTTYRKMVEFLDEHLKTKTRTDSGTE